MQICILLSPDGEAVRSVSPAYMLDDLYVSAAQYACGEPIPRGYASHAVWEKMHKAGYRVHWLTLSASDEAL